MCRDSNSMFTFATQCFITLATNTRKKPLLYMKNGKITKTAVHHSKNDPQLTK